MNVRKLQFCSCKLITHPNIAKATTLGRSHIILQNEFWYDEVAPSHKLAVKYSASQPQHVVPPLLSSCCRTVSLTKARKSTVQVRAQPEGKKLEIAGPATTGIRAENMSSKLKIIVASGTHGARGNVSRSGGITRLFAVVIGAWSGH
jgi:hypothetical protein